MRVSLTISVVVLGVLVAGCNKTPQPNNNAGAALLPAAEEKVGTTTRSGVISQAGNSFFIQQSGGQPEEIESYSVDLSQYVGQTVTVSGQFSGNTLFVDNIE